MSMRGLEGAARLFAARSRVWARRKQRQQRQQGQQGQQEEGGGRGRGGGAGVDARVRGVRVAMTIVIIGGRGKV